MHKIKTYLLENRRAKCKIAILDEGAFHIAITENDFFVNPCFEKYDEEIIEKQWEEYLMIEIGDGYFFRVSEDFANIDILRREEDLKVLFNFSNIDLRLKDINGNICQGNSFSVHKDEDEKFYGLGQHQENVLNYNGTKVNVYHDYKAKGGEIIGIPYLYSSKGYGLINNTLAQTCVDFTEGNAYTWTTDCAEDFSIYLFMGTPKKIYSDLAKLIGKTPMPLKSALGYIQCKQRYESQEEILQVAKKYREKNYPIDMMVVDWFYWKTLGDMSMNEEEWPDPKAMNDWLKKHGMDTMISVWPRFMKESTYYDELEKKGWFVKDQDGNTVYGTEEDKRGALIDTTNPKCGAWYWKTIYENLGKLGFNAWWTDENEPDLWPYDYTLDAGKGYEIFNLYPYTHVKSIYEGHRKEYDTRCLILSRSAYLGSQKFGTQFWSSDVYPTWGVLEKQVPAAINFCASGMGYWSSDIGGWQALPDYEGRSQFGVDELLIETQGSSSGVVTSENYAELYTRWFQFSVFCPVLRAHGTRDENEIWSYGTLTEYILKNQLKLRYELMPYIYSMAHEMYKNGTPILRGLFLEFPEDEMVLEIKDQYMFGDTLLVAPVLQAGQTEKRIYLPKGCVWYDFYSREIYIGGTHINVDVSLDHIPVFVRGNRILPLTRGLKNTKEKMDMLEVNLYGEKVSPFYLYEDDGRTYAYESGDYKCYRIECVNKKVYIYDDGTNEQIRSELPWKLKIQYRA